MMIYLFLLQRFRGEEEMREAETRNHLVRRFNEANNLIMPGTIAPLYAQEDGIELKTLEKVSFFISKYLFGSVL